MIRINVIPNSSSAKKYYRSQDYYVEGQELVAHWHGKGAELLGLSGPVAQADFERLCGNRHPATGAQLTAKHIQNRRVGYDFTFSVPKSVSIAYALGRDERLPGEFLSAVADTVAEMEREFAARVRRKGADFDRRTGNMVWVDFLHHTSRPIAGTPDPQLHLHAVVFNATFDREEQQWKAGQFGGVKADAPYFESVFRARLANRLKVLGYEIRQTKGDFEIAGIPERTIKEFSRRTSLIEKTAELLGIRRPESKAKLGATTREAKTDGQSWDSLVAGWEKRLEPGELEAIESAVQRSHREPARLIFDNRRSLDWALRHLTERNSVVTERELLTAALKYGLGTVTQDGLHDELGKRKDLIRREVGGQSLVSTQGVLAEERKVVAFAQKRRGRFQPLGPTLERQRNSAAVPALGRAGEHFRDAAKVDASDYLGDSEAIVSLSPSQRAAVFHAWHSRDPLILIRGAAGTGKTTMTRALLEGVNVPWVMLAPSAEASRGVLRREGFEGAETLAKFLLDGETQEKARGGLIVLDEASLAGARDMAQLIEVAHYLHARVLLLGDRRQHKSVARGDVLALLEDRAGLPVAEVSEIRRQSGAYRDAVKLASQGRVSEAFGMLDELGWVREGTEALVDDYLDAVKGGKSVLVVSPTHAEGDAVTARLREALKKGGRWLKVDGNVKEVPLLAGEEKRFQRLENQQLTEAERTDPETLRRHSGAVAQFVRRGQGVKAGERVAITAENAEQLAKQGSRFVVYSPREVDLAAGDAVRFTANGRDATGKHRLNNGSTYSVDGFTDVGDIRLSNGWIVSKHFGHFAHGYVVTSHAAQGRTVDAVLVAQSAQSFRASGTEQFYVSISRGKHNATIYTSDKEELRDAIQREDRRMLASDLVRAPRKGIREKLKRRVSFLRELGNIALTKVRTKERNYNMEIARE